MYIVMTVGSKARQGITFQVHGADALGGASTHSHQASVYMYNVIPQSPRQLRWLG